MQLSYFLAQLFGLTLVFFALAALSRKELVDDALRSFKGNSFVTIVAGFIGIMGGLAVILAHNIWEFDWPVLVTLFGWAAFIKGAIYIVAPEAVRGYAKSVIGTRQKLQVMLIIVLIVGAYMAYKGFGY